MKKVKLIQSAAVSVLVTVLFVVLITILTEEVSSLKVFLTNMSGHHWVSKSIIGSLLLGFLTLALYWLAPELSKKNLKHVVKAVPWSIVIGIITIFVYFTLHYLGLY